MATHDYVIANGTGAAVRSDLNDALAAIVSNNSSSTEPATTYAYQWWADTNANVLKIRNSANNAWITLRELDGTMLIEDGSASSPGLAFADDTNTGIFSGGADEINISTGGTERVVVNSSGKVGVGSAAPDAILEVGGVATSGETEAFAIERSDGVDLYRINYDPSTNSMEFQANNKEFAFQNLSSFAESVRIDDAGRLLVGLSSARANFFNSASGQETQLQIEGNNYLKSGASFTSNATATDQGPHIVLAHERSGSVGGNTIVADGSNLGTITFQGSDGSEMVDAARIVAEVNGAPSANDMPGKLVFLTTADGASGPTKRMDIESSGKVVIHKPGSADQPNLILTSGGAGDPGSQDPRLQFSASGFESQGTTEIRSTGSYNARALAFYTGTDTNGSEQMRLNSQGNLLLGTTDGGFFSGRGLKLAHADGARIKLCDTDTGVGQNDGFEFAFAGTDAYIENREVGNLIIATSNTERMRITAGGQCLFNTNTTFASGVQNIQTAAGDLDVGVRIKAHQAGVWGVAFQNSSNTNVGKIVINASSVQFATTSDYRLKENVVAIADGIDRVKQLQPRRFNFIDDADITVDGFLAHEAQTVVPEAITGTHNEVDDDNNPVYQGIDQSKLVPLLTAALQEAIAKIETLETKVAALEAG